MGMRRRAQQLAKNRVDSARLGNSGATNLGFRIAANGKGQRDE